MVWRRWGRNTHSSTAMTHFSRLSEELVLWMNPRFGYVKIADRFCTGSSIMPQKKNPDVPELARGKTGRVNGHLVAMALGIGLHPEGGAETAQDVLLAFPGPHLGEFFLHQHISHPAYLTLRPQGHHVGVVAHGPHGIGQALTTVRLGPAHGGHAPGPQHLIPGAFARHKRLGRTGGQKA